MIIPTGTVSAGNTEVQQSFASQTLAGLGNCGDCLQYDDTGVCQEVDTSNCGAVTSSGPSSIDLCSSNPQLCGTGTVANPSATTVYPSSTGTASTTTTGYNAAQIALLSQITANAGTIGKELALSPGTTVSASGAVSQQNPGYAIPGTTGVASLTTSGGSMMLIALVGLGALLFMNARK